ncbi:MAG: 23S rRNA (uracil(1939)-C(5))-methyltransferase RlmD [Chlamydiia bacterium]|nr:23S rRNA (uracil(1939)-C(5))-methyltransferase RlmD [Chlamydiia bacterium]
MVESSIISSPSSFYMTQFLCPHFGVCGGCRFQTTVYEDQLAQKQQFVEGVFAPYLSDAVIFNSIIRCESPWHYRNKMEFSFSQSKEGEQFLGLRISKKRGRVVNLETCLISPPWVPAFLDVVRLWWKKENVDAYFPPKDSGTLRTLTIRNGTNTGDRMGILTISGNSKFDLTQAHISSFTKSVQTVLCHPKDSLILVRQVTQKKVPTRFETTLLFGPGIIREKMKGIDQKELNFIIRWNAFFQPNTLQSELIYKKALFLSKLTKNDILYDLYCGTGTISLFASPLVKQAIGIELIPEAVFDGKENIFNNQVNNVTLLRGTVEEVLEQQELPRPTCVILDPPRAGLTPKAIVQVKKLDVEKIVYISCNPATQAENIKYFIESGYDLKEICPIDQFPHTSHIENIVVLKKKRF